MFSLRKLFSFQRIKNRETPLYAAVVKQARMSHWYKKGGIEDSVEGRFTMLITILAMVSDEISNRGMAVKETILLTEEFIDDMEGNVRELGVSDLSVSKQIGAMMELLGGRLETVKIARKAPQHWPIMIKRNLLDLASKQNRAKKHKGRPSTEINITYNQKDNGEDIGRINPAIEPVDHNGEYTENYRDDPRIAHLENALMQLSHMLKALDNSALLRGEFTSYNQGK